MKSLVLVVLLAVAATAAVIGNEDPDVVMAPEVAEDSELAAVADRRNLSVGHIGNSFLYFSQQYRTNGIMNRIIVVNIPVTANGRRITAVRVTRIGASTNATPSIVNGGIGNTHVTIRIQSARSRGYNYMVQVYA